MKITDIQYLFDGSISGTNLTNINITDALKEIPRNSASGTDGVPV